MRQQGAAFLKHLASCRRGTDECWIWPAVSGEGWGKTLWRGRLRQAHRAVYEELIGPIPEGHELDHLCKVRACVNPAHLEPVPPYINLMRSEGWAARNARKTHCPKGHPYTDESRYHQPGTPHPRRVCRECHRAIFKRIYRQRDRKPATHCRRGHPLCGDNIYTDKRGGRTCKKCHAEKRRLNYLRHKAQQAT